MSTHAASAARAGQVHPEAARDERVGELRTGLRGAKAAPFLSVEPDPTSVLIVGNGQAAALCSKTLVDNTNGKLRLAGVVHPHDVPLLLHSARQSGASTVPGLWVIALDDRRGLAPLHELVELRFQGVRIQDTQSFLEELTGKVPVESIRPGDLIYSSGFSFPRWKMRGKVAIEWFAALALMLLTAPLVLLAILGTLLDTGRPLFFRQDRVGLDGKRFRVIKLRTMYRDAEKNGPQFASSNDLRVTRLGKFLRKMRIDELPQLWNVLKGEMSLIGPRPERPEFVSLFEELIPYFRLRHSVRPGLTGWAQVNNGYASDAEGTREKLSYDLFYIKHFSFTLEFRIACRTFLTIVRGEGR